MYVLLQFYLYNFYNIQIFILLLVINGKNASNSFFPSESTKHLVCDLYSFKVCFMKMHKQLFTCF